MTLFRITIATWLMMLGMITGCSDDTSDNGPGTDPVDTDVVNRNITRAMELTDAAIAAQFTGDGMAMARYYNPYTEIRSDEKGSVWMYTSAMEAVNAILNGLTAQKAAGNSKLYDANFSRYTDLQKKLFTNIDFYQGTFQFTSYTQTKSWSVYGVNRGDKGTAAVDGVNNVYDDQMWLIRELLNAYKVTGDNAYLTKAEYLVDYVLDGWDATRDANGNEVGGITWGPGYVTKHSCSNGPVVSSLVWLSEMYKGKSDQITHRYVDPTDKQTRLEEQVNKSDYYLDFAKKIYAWQVAHLMRPDGTYDDLMGGCSPGDPATENVNGTTYRKGITCQDRVGPAISYNSGSMISAAADLYRVTNDASYLNDGKALSDATFTVFAKLGANKPDYYTYDISGFNDWFNDVMMRGYVDLYPQYKTVSKYIDTFQANLDYAHDNYAYKGFLPTNLLVGWNQDKGKNNTEGMFTFAFAAEYAVLARYQLEK